MIDMKVILVITARCFDIKLANTELDADKKTRYIKTVYGNRAY